MNLPASIVFILVLSFLSLRTPAQESGKALSRQYTRNYQLAKTAFDKGDLQTAAFYLNDCIARRPHDKDALLPYIRMSKKRHALMMI